jgi:hypothetical protein
MLHMLRGVPPLVDVFLHRLPARGRPVVDLADSIEEDV